MEWDCTCCLYWYMEFGSGRGDEEVLVSGVRGWGRPQPQANGDIEEGWMFLTLRTVGEFRVDTFI